MTGYGSGRSSSDGLQCVVEISSVNRRQSELLVNLPRELLALEPRVRETVGACIARGRLNVNIACQRGSETATSSSAAPAFVLDYAAAHAFHQAALALQTELGVPGGITMETILRAPGVLRMAAPAGAPNVGNQAADASASSPAAAAEAAWPLLQSALGHALDALVAMREREGRHLADDLRARAKTLRGIVAEIRARAPRAVENQRRALRERLAQSGVDFPPDDERLARELALFADRCDIAEELTRLEGHLDQLDTLLGKTEPIGRTLDFLGQELARELNTLGVKANDLEISRLAIAGKAELEKIREQVQNIE